MCSLHWRGSSADCMTQCRAGRRLRNLFGAFSGPVPTCRRPLMAIPSLSVTATTAPVMSCSAMGCPRWRPNPGVNDKTGVGSLQLMVLYYRALRTMTTMTSTKAQMSGTVMSG